MGTGGGRGFEGLLVRLKHNLIDGRVYTRLVPEPSLIPKMRGVAWGPVEADGFEGLVVR